jgi:hypothetical protein
LFGSICICFPTFNDATFVKLLILSPGISLSPPGPAVQPSQAQPAQFYRPFGGTFTLSGKNTPLNISVALLFNSPAITNQGPAI